MVTGYCVKCRQTVEMQRTEDFEMKNKKKAIKGVCANCGKTLFRIKRESREGMW